jgi:hypothetical protein
MKSNYKYSAHPKAGDTVTIIDGYCTENLRGRTGKVLRGRSKMGYTYFVEVVGMGIHRFHIKNLFKLSL